MTRPAPHGPAPAGSKAGGLSAEREARVRAIFDSQPAMRLIGARLTEIGDGAATIELPHRDDLTQHDDYIHGGIVGMIADTAAGCAGFTRMPPDATGVLTVEYKINLMAPALGERLLARGRVLKTGRTLTIAQAEVHALRDGTEHAVAVLQQTLIAVRGR